MTVVEFPRQSAAVPPGGGPLFILFLAQHSACVRTMHLLKRRRIRARDFHDRYLVELERFWELEEEAIVALAGGGLDATDAWDSFCVARTLYRVTQGAVLLDRDERA